MTNKEKELLHSEKCVIETVVYKRPQGDVPRYILSMSLSLNELLAMVGLTHECESESASEQDISAYIKNALQRSNIKID